MRIRRLDVPIAMSVGLVILAGAPAGINATKDQAPQSSISEAGVSPTPLSLRSATPWDQRHQPATYSGPLERKISGRVPVATPEPSEAVKLSSGAGRTVEKNSTYTAGNGAMVNNEIGGNIAKLSQHSWHAELGTRSGRDGDNQVSHLAEKGQQKYPELGSRLNDLAARDEEGRASAQNTVDGATVNGDRSFAVIIYLSGNVANVADFLEDHGGDPRNVGEDYIEAYVPVRLLGELSGQSGVLRVRETHPGVIDGTVPVINRSCCHGKREADTAQTRPIPWSET